MEWQVIKMGVEMFDALHAYGLGTFISSDTEAGVELEDKGCYYRLSSQTPASSNLAGNLLQRVLRLPTVEDIEGRAETSDPVALANLDGMLAALFTTPGSRVVSVGQLRSKKRERAVQAEVALTKAEKAIRRWTAYVERMSTGSANSVEDMLMEYREHQASIPILRRSMAHDINALMTLDPSFSLSSRRPLSDGLISDRDQLAISSPRYASVLAYIGAARFLRAHHVTHHLVNFYVPLVHRLTIHRDSALPLLSSVEHTSKEAIVLRWLNVVCEARSESEQAKWSALAYHVMQTQGAMQSISVGRGCLDLQWILALEPSCCSQLVTYWYRLLNQQIAQREVETDNLIDMLMNRRAAAWQAHLWEISWAITALSDKRLPRYELETVREVTRIMVQSPATPLSLILEREQGTLRFGHALRLLGNIMPSDLSDIVHELDSIRTRDELIRVLAFAVQNCVAASARSEFIVVPSDEDLKSLLDDIDQYSAPTIAKLLIILSSLRYPKVIQSSDSSK